jgi:hypothetical protein
MIVFDHSENVIKKIHYKLYSLFFSKLTFVATNQAIDENNKIIIEKKKKQMNITKLKGSIVTCFNLWRYNSARSKLESV